MTLRFTVLASGSAGNASLVQAGEFGVLIDIGLGPRQLAARLAAVGSSWQQVHAVLLTHTHSDHWRDTTLTHLHRRRIPVYCHPGHQSTLSTYAPVFDKLEQHKLVRTYEERKEIALAPGLSCRPFPLRHDSGPTFGFRIEAAPALFGQRYAVAYAADLGCWDADVVEALLDADVLALEFNHDVAMQYASGRHPLLIARILGEEGHLSNDQAAALLCEVIRRSTPERARHLVQLHLSRDCNDPELASDVAHEALDALGAVVEVHTASQYAPGATLHAGIMNGTSRRRPFAERARRTPSAICDPAAQPWLPGLE